MSVRDLVALYALVGIACAAFVYRRRRGSPGVVWQAAGTGLLWPLLAPFTMGEPEGRAPMGWGRHERVFPASDHPAVDRALRAIATGLAVVVDTPYAAVFTATTAAKFEDAVHHAAARLSELDGALAAAGHVAGHAGPDASPAPDARLQAIRRLLEHHAQTTRQLEELAQALEALKYRLLVARFDDLRNDEVADLIAEARAHAEALGGLLGPDARGA